MRSASRTTLSAHALDLLLAAKGNFIVNSGLAGFSVWQAGGDSDDILVDSIRGAIGGYTGTSGC